MSEYLPNMNKSMNNSISQDEIIKSRLDLLNEFYKKKLLDGVSVSEVPSQEWEKQLNKFPVLETVTTFNERIIKLEKFYRIFWIKDLSYLENLDKSYQFYQFTKKLCSTHKPTISFLDFDENSAKKSILNKEDIPSNLKNLDPQNIYYQIHNDEKTSYVFWTDDMDEKKDVDELYNKHLNDIQEKNIREQQQEERNKMKEKQLEEKRLESKKKKRLQ